MIPILKALRRHKTTVLLVVLEIALACAIVTNALFVIGHRLADMRIHTGVADNELVWAASSGLADAEVAPAKPKADTVPEDLAALRAIPGVKSAVRINTLPLTHRSWTSCVGLHAGDGYKQQICHVVLYAGTPGLIDTLGLHVDEGRSFRSDDFVGYDFGRAAPPPSVIISRAFAAHLWPGQDPLGKPLFMGGNGTHVMHVVGVVDHLLNPSIRRPGQAQWNLLLPVSKVSGIYVLRTTRQARDRVYRDLPAVLEGIDDNRIITERGIYANTVSNYFHNDRALIWLLTVVIGCLLALTALGVVGLSSFWVQQRTHQIGIRRAVGARRSDILRDVLVENFVIVTAGIVLGLAGAVGLNLWLMRHYELTRLPTDWLPGGAVVLWSLGLLAALGPALRASHVPPVVATRSV